MSRYGVFFVILATFFWGLAGGIAGLLINNGWDSYVVAFYRGLFGFVFVAFWLIVSPKNSGLGDPKLWLWSAFAGLGVAGNFSFYFLSIQEGSVAIAVTLMYCAPIFVYLISFALKLEKATPRKLVSILLVVVGVALMTQLYDVNASTITPLAIISGLLSGASYALFIFGFKYATKRGSPQAILLIAFLVLSSILLALSWDFEVFLALGSEQWMFFVLLGILGAGLSFIFYVKGLKYTAPAIASVVAIIEPVTASLFSFFVFDERLEYLQIFGMLLILLTVTVFTMHPKGKNMRHYS